MLHVFIQNGQVIKCIDTIPPNEPGWRDAVEIAPIYIPDEQYLGQVTFDTSKTPVQITWPVLDYTPEQIASNKAESQRRMIETYVKIAQDRLDDFAKTRNYEGILSACTYASSSVLKFASEGQYALLARDTTWAACYALMGEVQAGTHAVPTTAEFEAVLPALAWPA